MKSVKIRNFFWSVFSCIQTEYRKIRTKKTPYLKSLCNLVIKLSHRPLSRWKGGQAIDFLLREQYIYCYCPEIKFSVEEFFGTCERIPGICRFVILTKEILNRSLNFLCSVFFQNLSNIPSHPPLPPHFHHNHWGKS